MKECCDTCRLQKKLIKYDYSQGGCIHADCEGFACMGFASEGIIAHMVGCPIESDKCEMYSPKDGGDEADKCI